MREQKSGRCRSTAPKESDRYARAFVKQKVEAGNRARVGTGLGFEAILSGFVKVIRRPPPTQAVRNSCGTVGLRRNSGISRCSYISWTSTVRL